MTIKLKQSGIVNVKFQENITIVEPVNMYDCEIGKNSFIGPFVEIQRGVIIGSSTKIQSHTFICELVVIGNNCFIGHGVVFINDLFKEGKGAVIQGRMNANGEFIASEVLAKHDENYMPPEAKHALDQAQKNGSAK